jgi:hypothetical protein
VQSSVASRGPVTLKMPEHGLVLRSHRSHTHCAGGGAGIATVTGGRKITLRGEAGLAPGRVARSSVSGRVAVVPMTLMVGHVGPRISSGFTGSGRKRPSGDTQAQTQPTKQQCAQQLHGFRVALLPYPLNCGARKGERRQRHFVRHHRIGPVRTSNSAKILTKSFTHLNCGWKIRPTWISIRNRYRVAPGSAGITAMSET